MRKREFPSILGDPATLNFEPGYIVQILTHPHKVSKSTSKVSFLFLLIFGLKIQINFSARKIQNPIFENVFGFS